MYHLLTHEREPKEIDKFNTELMRPVILRHAEAEQKFLQQFNR